LLLTVKPNIQSVGRIKSCCHGAAKFFPNRDPLQGQGNPRTEERGRKTEIGECRLDWIDRKAFPNRKGSREEN
jgi:hypothetical protein